MREAMTVITRCPKPARPAFPAARRNPRLLLGIGGRMAAELALLARSQGWDVVRAATCDDVRRLAAHGGRGAVVLPAEGDAERESGYLVCVKLLRCQPGAKVWLAGPESGRARRRAAFAGATGYLSADDRLAPVILAG